jgi:DNA invertase Pin-like site-specific DNA recombinase
VLELKRQIAAAGDALVKEYVDDGFSGSLLDRPGLEALRRDVRAPLFDAVYFIDTDRIGTSHTRPSSSASSSSTESRSSSKAGITSTTPKTSSR